MVFIHLARKKDGKIRLCGDYRALNNRTKMDRYAPRILKAFTQNLEGSKIFSKIDLIRAYNQIPVAPESIEKNGHYYPIRTFRIFIHTVWPSKCKPNMSVFRRRNNSRIRFRLRVHRPLLRLFKKRRRTFKTS
jgi:hypothetical protein